MAVQQLRTEMEDAQKVVEERLVLSSLIRCLLTFFSLPTGYSPEDAKRGDACEGDSGGPFVMKVCTTSTKAVLCS